MIETIIFFLTALAFGISISLLLFGSVFFYRVFSGETFFEDPLIPMGVSFTFISTGMALLFFIFV